MVMRPLESVLVTKRLYLEVPIGYEAKIRLRSGLDIKKGITVLNSPGTIDADYRGEVCVILVNLSESNFIIKDGERICQMVISKNDKTEWIEVDVLLKTKRGDRGFGNTGKE